MKKILIITPNSSHVFGFRKSLIDSLKSKGFAVSVVAFDEEYKQSIADYGIDFYCVKDNNRSLNPFNILSLSRKIKKVIKTVKPDTVFTFQLKPNLFGVVAAHKAGIENIYSMVEGGGETFTKNGFKWKIIRRVVCFLYRRAFKHSKKVFFLNNGDKVEFISRKLVKEEQCELVHGIGVDLEKFACKPVKNGGVFLMVARMLKTKGVFDYCECARAVKSKYPDAVFNYLGQEGDIKLSHIDEYIKDGSVNYLGTTQDVRPFLEQATVVMLPSYREGLPVSVMEAESVGRAIITYDTNGCRDTVKDGYNGFLVERQNVNALVEKCIYAIEHYDEMVAMGQNARKFAEEHFNCNEINDYILSVIS